MNRISINSVSSSFNYTPPAEEAPNRFASGPANSSPPATTSIDQASEGLQKPGARLSMQAQRLRQLSESPANKYRQNTMLVKSFDAQRLDINTQAGPSNSRHLNALNKLQQRNFKPAAGGLEIPVTPNSLLGGGKRVSQLGSSSRDIKVCPRGAGAALREQIGDKQELINTFIEELQEAIDEANPALIAHNTEQLRQARADLAELQNRFAILATEHNRINQ
ncbi:XopO/AvrRps4 family type III secretion system effector [Pseudomonas tremae]|uniref:XopO/AvrRps4 family type III secretion system effector n=1 Tax=Pseudomonas tremae TaxID=200454 RepID=UPI001F3A156F|nr:XopO/AvrRps4 family type III secretion system effector [Pseudomonas tremae]MCF5806274.1 type III effector AvrRps4 [Pseudomonas tremae]MCF5811543.1 type III effector AvrRps4 [Pseudomonas tremae]